MIYTVSKLRDEDTACVLPSTGDYMRVDPLRCSVCRLFFKREVSLGALIPVGLLLEMISVLAAYLQM